MVELLALLLPLGCGDSPSHRAAASPPAVQEVALRPLPTLEADTLLLVLDRQTGMMHRFTEDGRWTSWVEGKGWVPQQPRPSGHPWGPTLAPEDLVALRAALEPLRTLPSELPAQLQGPAVVPNQGGALDLRPIAFVARLSDGQVVTVQITAHLDLPSSMGPLGDLFEVLDAVAFGRRFDE